MRRLSEYSPMVIMCLMALSCLMSTLQAIFCPENDPFATNKKVQPLSMRMCQGTTGLVGCLACVACTVLLLAKMFK